MSVLNKVISGFKGIMVKKGEATDIPTSEELGLEPDKPSSSFMIRWKNKRFIL